MHSNYFTTRTVTISQCPQSQSHVLSLTISQSAQQHIDVRNGLMWLRTVCSAKAIVNTVSNIPTERKTESFSTVNFSHCYPFAESARTVQLPRACCCPDVYILLATSIPISAPRLPGMLYPNAHHYCSPRGTPLLTVSPLFRFNAGLFCEARPRPPLFAYRLLMAKRIRFLIGSEPT